MKTDWNKIVLEQGDNVDLAEGVTLRPVQVFGGLFGPTNIIFDIVPTFNDYDSAFQLAGRAMRLLRNDDNIKEVYLTLEAHNVKDKGKSPTGLEHFLCQIRIELEGAGII